MASTQPFRDGCSLLLFLDRLLLCRRIKYHSECFLQPSCIVTLHLNLQTPGLSKDDWERVCISDDDYS